MAKKSKSKSKSKQHTRDLVSGMKQSNAQSSTPVSSLYPTKVTVGSSRTSPAHMQKGTHGSSQSHKPGKFLLSVTHPGTAPTAPTVVPPPGGAPTKRSYESYNADTDGFENPEDAEAYTAATGVYAAASSAYQTYLTALNAHNTSLANYNTNLSSYNTDASKNTTTTTKYNKDVSNFLKGLKGKVTKKQVGKLRGSRGNKTRLGGARG